MQSVLVISCLVVSLGWVAFVSSVFYSIDVRLSRRFNRFVTRHCSRRFFALFSAWMDFRFAGESNLLADLPPQYLIMSNHQSLFDIPLYMKFLDPDRLRFVAKAELGHHVPIVSAMLKSDEHCLVQRTGSPSKAMKAMDGFAERVLSHNWIPVIFPEGTRSVDGELGTFHPAGFRRFLDRAPMPVVVCAVEGGWRISSLRDLAGNLKGGFYRIKLLKIYPAPSGKAEQLRILEEGKALIQAQLSSWRL
jgi:1-acyl-sn-glycerol-3-phosphate acyltransferase